MTNVLDKDNVKIEDIEKKLGFDFLYPDDHIYITFLKKVFRHEFRKNGFRRISTSFFRDADFFKKIFGDKFYEKVITLKYNGEKNICLNSNPSIVNFDSYIVGDRNNEIQPVYSYYMDSFYDKDNDGLLKGKLLFGADVIGEDDVIIDIGNIFLVKNILDKIGLDSDYKIIFNFIGSKKEQENYKEKLQDFYEDKKHLLSEEGLYNLDNDIFKLLLSNDENEMILAKNAPKISKSYKKDNKKNFSKAFEYLDLLGINYELNECLFGEYDFNDGIIWQIRLKDDDSILAKGASYNQLSNLILDKKEIPGCGFNVDILKLVQILKQKNISIKNKDNLDLFFVQLGDEAKKVVLPLSMKAREAGIKTAVSLGTPSMKEQMLKAQRSNATYIVIVGVMEARSGLFQVRNLGDGTQEEVNKDEFIDYIISRIGKESLDFFEPSKDLLGN